MDILTKYIIIIRDLNHSMHNLFITLTDDERSSLKYVSLKKDETLFHENDKCENIGIVLSGKLTISSFTYTGNEIIYNTLMPTQVFGNNLIFSDKPFYRGEVVAKVDSTLVLINKEQLIEILRNNKEFLLTYLSIQSNFSKNLNGKIKMLSFDSAEERFLFYLKMNDNKLQFHSITDLAHELQLQRETLSRLISKLEKQKTIIYQREKKYIYLNQ